MTTTLAQLADESLTLVNTALLLARRARAANPPPGDLTDLNQTILELTKKSEKLESQVAALRLKPRVDAPDQALITEIKTLTGQVEASIRASATAREAIATGGRAIDAVQKSGLV